MSDIANEFEEKPREKSLRDLYYTLFRHKYKMILFFIAVIAVVALGTFLSDETYRSDAKLLVRIGRETVTLDPTASTGPIIPVIQSRQSEINTELEILKSREIAERVVDSVGLETLVAGSEKSWMQRLLKRLNLAKQLNERNAVVLRVMKNLEVEFQKESWILGVAYKAESPELAQEVLNKIIDCYYEKHIEVHRTPGSYQFFSQESNNLRGKLTQAENQLRDLMNQTGISSLEEQRAVILDRIGVLQTEIDRAEADLVSSGAKVQSLQSAMANTPELVVTEATVGLPNAAVDEMRGKLYDLQLLEQELVSKFEQDSRQVQDVRRQIAAANALLETENQARSTLTKGLNLTYQEIQASLFAEQANLSSLQAGVSDLKSKLEDAKRELRVLNDNSVKITALTREIEIQEENYRKYSVNLEQARIDDALESGKISNINVVQAATLPMKPIRPRKVLNLLLGLLTGIFGGIAIAFFSEYLDHSIKTPDEAEEKLRLPAIACIPFVRKSRISPKAKWDVPINLKVHYDVFKERLLLSSDKSRKEPQILAITSSHHDEGTSTIAANLATTLAQLGEGEVLLIDANLSHPSVHRIFESELSPGLADILTDGQSCEGAIVPSPVQNLYLLSAGTINGNISEIFDSNGFTSLLNSIKKNYRFVVIDLPAVNDASWSVRVAGLCDGVGLVIEAERSRWEVAQRTKELLVKANAKVIGAIINKRRFYIPKWLYRTL